MPKVSIVKKPVPEMPDLYSDVSLSVILDMIDETFRNLGGYAEVTSHPQSVIIKPNLVEVPHSGTGGSVMTDPRVLEALIIYLKDQGVSDIIVAEGKSVNLKHISSGAIDAFNKSGMGKAVKRAGARLIGWDEEPFVEVPIPDGQLMKSVRVPKSILDTDYFINVPKLKTHCQTEVTIGIKSMQGVYSVEDKIRFHNEAFPWKMLDMLRAAKPDLNIVDGLIAGEGYGPIYTKPVKMDLLIASEDVVATDVVSGKVMMIDPIDVPITRLAIAEGLGEGDMDRIDIVGESLDSVSCRFQRPQGWNPIGMHKHLKIFAGCACRFELCQIGAAIQRLTLDGKIGRLKQDVCIIVGSKAPVPVQHYENVIIVGDDAMDHPWYGKYQFIPGNPPLPSVQIVDAIEQYLDKE